MEQVACEFQSESFPKLVTTLTVHIHFLFAVLSTNVILFSLFISLFMVYWRQKPYQSQEGGIISLAEIILGTVINQLELLALNEKIQYLVCPDCFKCWAVLCKQRRWISPSGIQQMLRDREVLFAVTYMKTIPYLFGVHTILLDMACAWPIKGRDENSFCRDTYVYIRKGINRWLRRGLNRYQVRANNKMRKSDRNKTLLTLTARSYISNNIKCI